MTAPIEQAAERVSALARDYRPPSFAHVPDPDSGILLCAFAHRSGYPGR